MRVKTYEEIKREQAAIKEKKKKAINDILTSATNNPKFAKFLTYSFNSLEKMITPPGLDVRLNAQLIIETGGVEVLRSIALKNSHNEELCKQISNIIFKLTSQYFSVDQELAQKFVAAKGHEAVIEILLSKNKGPGSIPLIKCLHNLCQVPQLVNKLLDAGIAETIKLVNDLYSDDITVIRLNLDTMKKVSNQKNGRDFLIKRGIVPSIITTIKKCSDRADTNAVTNGLIVLDNLCRNEEGKKEVKEADAPSILCDVVETFSESAKIINKSAKISTKIIYKSDLDRLLHKMKTNSEKLDNDDKEQIIEEIKEDSALVSNLMLVDDLCKSVCQPENFDMLVSLFKKLCKINLANKKPGYVKNYIQGQKHFMTLFKRAFDHMPDCLIQNTEKGQKYKELVKTIHDCIKKNWDATKSNDEQLKKEGNKEEDIIPLKNAFKGFFTSYSQIIKQNNDSKDEEEKKDPNWLELLNYIVGDVISKGKEYFGEDEKPNYAASNILKISDDIINESKPEEIINLPKNVKKCFPYIKSVIGFSDNWRTLKNDLEVVHNTNKKEDQESELKKDTIPVITKFMGEKYKFRNPNLINLNILDDYLTQPFVNELLSKKGDVKANPNLGLDFINAIDSVMAKPFYSSSTVLKELDGEDDEKGEDEELKEPKSEEIEKKIISKGSTLLKRLIPLEEFLRQLREFKKNANSFNPETSKVEDTLKLEDNLIYQNCALNVDEFFNAGMNDDFTTLRDLIKKEINFIEGFKRLKSNENNPKYNEICDASNKRLQLHLGTLRKLEDQGIDKYGNTKEEKYNKLLKDIINLNSEVITKSTDSPNLIEHLNQLKNNVGFLRDNESDLVDEKGVIPSELYVNSLMKLLNKSLNDEDLCDSIIKTLIALANKRPGICNSLVKAGCPRLLLRIMDKTQNKQLAGDAMELFKMINVSSQENAKVIGNQNILTKLFRIRSKFASSDSITKNSDSIANELTKFPGQTKFIEKFIHDAIKEFHENVKKDFKNEEVKNKILNNEETINSFTFNQEAIKPILEKEFIEDLNKAVDLAANDEEVSNTIDKLLQNDAGILKKIKDNLSKKEDERHGDVVADTLKIIDKKSNFEEPLLLSCKNLSDYVKDDTLYNKYLNDKIDENFADKLLDIQDNYLENPEITKEINNLLCYLSLRNPKLAEAIVKKGGLSKVIEELKSVANLNDLSSKMLKLNGLKMLNSLLNNTKNLDEFLNAGGVDLINKIVKNEVDNTPTTKTKEDSENENPSDKYLTFGTISTKTPEQLKEEEKLGINSFANLGMSKEDADNKREQILNQMKDGDKKRKDSTSSSTTGGEENSHSDDSDNYFVQCLKIINKGLDNGKNEFVDDKTVKNLTNLATVNFPDKFIFNEIASILSNEHVKLNPDAIEDLKDLMKLGLSNKAQFYHDNNVGQKVKAIEDKIANMLMNDLRYKTGLKNAIKDKGFNSKPIPGKLKDDRIPSVEKKRAEDEQRKIPGMDLYDKYGNKLDDNYKKVDSDGPSVELYDKDGNKLEGTYKKIMADDKPEDLYDKDKNKLDDNYKKIFGNIKGDDLYDKNGNKLDGKYVNILSHLPTNEIFDINGKKLFGLYRKIEPNLENKELYDKGGNKLDGTYNKLEEGLPGIEGYDKDGNKLAGKFEPNIDESPLVELYNKNKNKLDGLYKPIISEEETPTTDIYDKDGNKINGTFKKLKSSAPIPVFNPHDKDGKKLDNNYAKIISSLPKTEIFDQNGKQLNGLYTKTNLIPGKLNDDRFQDFPLSQTFDDLGQKEEDVTNKILPGKLKMPFDTSKKEDNENIPSNKISSSGQKLPEGENEEKPEEDNLRDSNRLLTYLSLASESENFKNIFDDAKEEIGSFFNKLNEAYKPVIQKILEDREKKIRELEKNNKNTPENILLLEPFNINSLPEKEKYDEGVILSLSKLYNYILDQNNKDKTDNQGKPLPGKLKNPFDKEGQEDKDEINTNKIIPGKLKNPFENQDKKEEINKKKIIPGKLKQKFGEHELKEPKLRKQAGKKDKIPKEKSDILKGELDPEDHINNEFLNNLKILAEPLYTPENYIFVNKFNKEMDKLMDNLGRFEKDSSDEDNEEAEPTDNYLTHLNSLFTKAVLFMDDLHKEIAESPNGQYPDANKEKEENLKNILDAVEEYYNIDEDAVVKANNSKNMVNSALNLIEDLNKEGIIDKETEKAEKKEVLLNKKLGKLWDLVNHAVNDDERNQLLEPDNSSRMKDLVKNLNEAIENPELNKPEMRFIAKNLSKKIENGEDELAKDLLDFTMKDLEKNNKDNEEIKDINMDTIATLSKFSGQMKQIMKNENVFQQLQKDNEEPELVTKKRGVLATVFNNASKNNYNIENMINDDPDGVKSLLKKIIHDPVKSLDDGGEEIAEKEVETLCNILKDRNNYRSLASKKIITDDDINKLQDLYKDLDPKLTEPLKPILDQLKEADKANKEREEILEDENKITDLEKKVGDCLESDKKAIIAYASNPENELSSSFLPGKLKIPFDFMKKTSPETEEKPIPGKLKSPFDNQDNKDQNKNLKNILDSRAENILRKMSLNTSLVLISPVKENIKSPLSTKENPEISEDLEKILSLLRKSYNDMKATEDPELNIKRVENVHKCLNLLKKMAFSPDNHKPMLEGGFMNFMEKLDDDYKLFKENGEPDINNKNLGFALNAKNVLQACSNSDNAIPIIAESPVLDSTIDEVTKLYDKPEVIASNEDVKKIFNYDNVIFSNLCKDKKAFGDIFKKIGLDKLLELGKKSTNPNLLDAILNMLNNYVKNEEKEEIPPEIIEPTLEIMKKCGNLEQRTAPLMSKVLLLSGRLYNDKLKPKIDSLNLVEGMNKDIDKFKGNHGYVNACLNNLSKFTKEDAENGQKALNSGLLKKLNDQVSVIVKEGPEKYEEKKDVNEEEGENGYLKTCYNLTKLYNNLVQDDMDNVNKFSQMGITDNTINMLDHFNKKVEPKTPEEIEKERENESLGKADEKSEKENENLTPEEMVREIMKNCAGTMNQITVPTDSNEFLANKTNFYDTMCKILENPNNDKNYIITTLHSLGNHLYTESGKNYSKIDLPRLYKILKDLQSIYYSDPEVLTNTNYISGALVKNLKDDAKGKEYTKKFYDLIPETTKCQDNNSDLVNLAMKLMHDGLVKKPYLVDEVYEETVPNMLNLLKLYKDNPEIQENGYKILSLFSKNPTFAAGMVNNGLLNVIKETLDNPLFNDSLKEQAKGLKDTIYKMLKSLSSEDDIKPKISDELMENLIPVVDEKGYNEEGKDVVDLLNCLVMNKKCVPPFVQYKGIDSCTKLLNDNDSNLELIPTLFSLFKSVSNASDEYKKMMKEKKLSDAINRTIKKIGIYDKKIEFEGRQLLFNVNMVKVKLEDPNSIGVEDYKLVEPIPSEVRNFLTSGKQVKIINDKGDVKQMQLIFSPDLMKVSARKVKSALPPKQKYIIETHTIKKILKGHGTDAFKKSKGLFRKIPPPEICFSIIGPTTVDGPKSLNVQCEDEKEVNKWLNYLSLVINYFKKTHAIKGAVIIKK